MFYKMFINKINEFCILIIICLLYLERGNVSKKMLINIYTDTMNYKVKRENIFRCLTLVKQRRECTIVYGM